MRRARQLSHAGRINKRNSGVGANMTQRQPPAGGRGASSVSSSSFHGPKLPAVWSNDIGTSMFVEHEQDFVHWRPLRRYRENCNGTFICRTFLKRRTSRKISLIEGISTRSHEPQCLAIIDPYGSEKPEGKVVQSGFTWMHILDKLEDAEETRWWRLGSQKVMKNSCVSEMWGAGAWASLA